MKPTCLSVCPIKEVAIVLHSISDSTRSFWFNETMALCFSLCIRLFVVLALPRICIVHSRNCQCVKGCFVCFVFFFLFFFLSFLLFTSSVFQQSFRLGVTTEDKHTLGFKLLLSVEIPYVEDL